MRRTIYIAIALATLAFGAPAAQAAAPVVTASWVTDVTTTSANLRAQIDPQGQPTTYLFEYTTDANYRAKGFTGAAKIPSTGVSIASGTVLQHTSGLESETTYRFRVVATSSQGVTAGAIRQFTTREVAPVFKLPDNRGWEMVSPIDKNGGGIQGFEQNYGGGVIQAAAQGGSITYSSSASFETPQGAPGAGQYISKRGSASWSTENITLQVLSGSYPEAPDSGVPYQLFSNDLEGALLSNGRRCRDSSSNHCPVANAPLPGSDAPAGFRNYYLRDNGNGTFQATLNSSDMGALALGPEEFEVALAGATPDLAHVVLSTCAKLTTNATEVAGSEGECNPAKANLYEKSGSGAPELVNLLPGETTGAPGASLAAQSGAISADGSRVYWTDGTNLYLREGSQTKQVDESAGKAGTFQTASTDGSVAYFTTGGELVTPPKHPEETPEEEELSAPYFDFHLWRYVAATNTATDLTPAGGLLGVLGTSDDGTYVYYAVRHSVNTQGGVYLWHEGVVTPVAPEAAPDSYPPTTGTARVSADGRHLAYVSSSFELTPYDSRNLTTDEPEPEVYIFTAPGSPNPGNVCVSCNPYGERPVGAAGLPGASRNGIGLDAYKPRVFSADSKRIFFDTTDSLVSQDTNNAEDVYQWEAFGEGSCAKPIGCVSLISSGRAEDGASFLDASTDGSDAFFLTDGSLVPSDPGAADVYDARVNGGYPLPAGQVPCFGDACQALPPEPEDPTPGTARSRPSGNLPTPPVKKPLKCKKNQVKRFGKCVKAPKKTTHKKRGGHR